MRCRRVRRVGLLAIAAGVVGLFLVAGVLLIFTLTHPAPGRLQLSETGAIPTPTPSSGPQEQKGPCVRPAGASLATYWTVEPGSQVGYRAREKFDLPHEAVARTDAVQGFVVIEQPTGRPRVLSSGCIAVEVGKLKSIDELPPPLPDATGRDQHYPKMFDTANHPYVVFRPERLELPERLWTGGSVTVQLAGELTIRGNSRRVTSRAQVKLTGGEVQAVGSFVVRAPDFGVQVPIQQLVQPDITLEFLLRLAPSSIGS